MRQAVTLFCFVLCILLLLFFSFLLFMWTQKGVDLAQKHQCGCFHVFVAVVLSSLFCACLCSPYDWTVEWMLHKFAVCFCVSLFFPDLNVVFCCLFCIVVFLIVLVCFGSQLWKLKLQTLILSAFVCVNACMCVRFAGWWLFPFVGWTETLTDQIPNCCFLRCLYVHIYMCTHTYIYTHTHTYIYIYLVGERERHTHTHTHI